MSHRRRTLSAAAISETQRSVPRQRANDAERPGQARTGRNLKRPDTDEDLAVRLAFEELVALGARERDRAVAERLHLEAKRAVRAEHSPITRLREFLGGIYMSSLRPNPLRHLRHRGTIRHSPQSPPRLTGHNCVSCLEDTVVGAEVLAPCNHHYDTECIVSLFEAATRDESLFPPRCCGQVIPLSSVQNHLPIDVLSRFKTRTREFHTRNRVYCARPTCSRFLGARYHGILPTSLAPIYKCPVYDCGASTCSSCKNEITHGVKHLCGVNAADGRVLSLAQDAGWVRCPACETLIELSTGCHHMTCRCKMQFCYNCRARWRTCDCTHWEERRLVAVAEERADAQIRVERVERVQRILRRDFTESPVQEPPPLPLLPVANSLSRAERKRQDVSRAATLTLLGIPPPTPPPKPRTPETVLPRIEEYDESPSLTPPSTAPSTRPASPIAGPSRPAENLKDSALLIPGTVTPPISGVSDEPFETTGNEQPGEDHERRHSLITVWVQRLRHDVECSHKWRLRRGEGLCSICTNYTPFAHYGCKECQTMICRRCRWNRV